MSGANDLTFHEAMLLKVDEAIRDPNSPGRDEVNRGVRADRLANSMDGVDGRSAADYVYAIRDLCDSGDLADLGRLRLTERGSLRVREVRSRLEPVINRDELHQGPEPYLGWYLEGEPGSPEEPAAYLCHATEDKGNGRFRVLSNAPGFNLDRAEQYEKAKSTAFSLARGLVFLGTWGEDGHEITLPPEERPMPTPQIRDALIRGLHRLYEDGFPQSDVVVDYEGVALALGVSERLVSRAAEHLNDIGLVTDHPATMTRNWANGHIWLTAGGVEHAEDLEPLSESYSEDATTADERERPTWDLFIAHASEDKEEVALPLYELLTERGLEVWLDANELRLGDGLRSKIDHGLANSRYGLVILSEAFFAKAWPQRELDGLTAIEVAGKKVILPVWHGVEREYVQGFSSPFTECPER